MLGTTTRGGGGRDRWEVINWDCDYLVVESNILISVLRCENW
jgi:hypothetical protein